VPRCVLPAALLVAAVAADGSGAHGFAFYLVLAAIPAVAVAALTCFGELVEGSADAEAGALYVGLTALALVLLVVAAAVRSNAVGHGAVPPLGVSAGVGALSLLGLQVLIRAWLAVARDGLVTPRRTTSSGV
jgi:hypothetical protein